MRIHANTLTTGDIREAARIARVDIVQLSTHGSRTLDYAFNVKLEGESRRRPNGGSSGAGSGYAATWDQWGVFLSILFDRDPTIVTTYYASWQDFYRATDRRFAPSIDGDFWPDDAHGDHTFRYQGVPRSQSCTKCSATQRR